jgi:nitrogen regulatory protein P-II 1
MDRAKMQSGMGIADMTRVKKVEAIIRPEKYEVVQKTLEKVGYSGLMVTEIQGHGAQRGVQKWRGKEYKAGLIVKWKVEVVCADKDVHKIVRAVAEAARTGEVGDGKIFVSPVDQALRVRNGETGEEAL